MDRNEKFKAMIARFGELIKIGMTTEAAMNQACKEILQNRDRLDRYLKIVRELPPPDSYNAQSVEAWVQEVERVFKRTVN